VNKLIYWACGLMLAASLVGCDKPASKPPTETSSADATSTASTTAAPPNKRQYPLEAPSVVNDHLGKPLKWVYAMAKKFFLSATLKH
jgi:hypothetical protein